MPQSPVPLGEVFAGKYRVDRILGEGGMGIVVAAHHLELDQTVAIKFLLDDIAGHDEGAERFRREARAAAKIHSDHVVRVLDVGILESGMRYMVMEYMDGHDLAEEIAEKGSFPVGVAAGYLLQALDAVGHAHAVGIVHRDLKPANLFLATRPDGTKRIKVLDFGISKSVGGATASELSLTKTSAWIGSPLYMAPEQMQSARDVDHRADIWSLGAILYELLSGQTPYQAESLPQLCNLLITQDPPHIKTVCPSVPDGLAEAVMGCLTRDRERRIQSTEELAHVLGNYASSITGSGSRASLFDQTEALSRPTPSTLGAAGSGGGYAPSLPAGLPRQGGTNPAGSISADLLAGQATAYSTHSPISDKTHAAWGATDSQEKPKPKMGLVLGGLAVCAALGFAVMAGTGSGEAEEKPVVVEAVQAGPEAPAPLPAPEPQVAAPAPEKEPELPAAPAPSALGEGERAPAPSPQKQVKPAKKPTSAPRPGPEPSPAPAPAKDDFADFGGRR